MSQYLKTQCKGYAFFEPLCAFINKSDPGHWLIRFSGEKRNLKEKRKGVTPCY